MALPKGAFHTLASNANIVKERVLRMEINYHLMTLHEALQASDTEEIAKQKRILTSKRSQLIKLTSEASTRK